MGLSGVKKRSKLSQDPNNTTWAKSTDNFGHKILAKQGWKPGDYLGAENASHSEHYTAANASHIRVMLREDNLGLGAKIGKGNAETFGLSMFSGLLGRLNGNSDGEVQKQQSALRDAELRTYTGQKYGFMNFVSGGLLVGDKIEPKEGKKDTASDASTSRKRKASEASEESSEATSTKKSKTTSAEPTQVFATKEKKKDRRSKNKASREETSAQDSSGSSSEDEKAEEKVVRKEKRKSEKKSKRSEPSTEDDEKARLKAEKRARKEERRRRKEEKRRKREAKASKDTDKNVQTSTAASESEGTATPPIQQAFSGRQAVRQRYIQQKRMASMDPQALKEIFMLQAKAAA